MLAKPEWIAEAEERLNPDWGPYWRLCRPNLEEFYRQMCEVRAFCGGDEDRTAQLLGVSVLTLRGWHYRRFIPNDAARRAVWLTWVLVLHPERIRSLFDILTWGRFSTSPRPQRKASFDSVAHEDYSI